LLFPFKAQLTLIFLLLNLPKVGHHFFVWQHPLLMQTQLLQFIELCLNPLLLSLKHFTVNDFVTQVQVEVFLTLPLNQLLG